MDMVEAVMSETRHDSASASMAAIRPVIDPHSDCSPPMAAATLGESAASAGATALSVETAQPAKVERWIESCLATVGDAPVVGAPRQRARIVADFSTTYMFERSRSLSSGLSGSVAPLVEMRTLIK